jgi:Putative peptidoglycan binding domain
MRTILVSMLCLSIISVAGAEQDKNKKKGGQQGGGGPAAHQQTQHVTGAKVHPLTTSGKVHNVNPSLQTHHNLPAIQKNTNITVNKNVTKNVTKITNYQPVKFKSVHIQNSRLWVGPRYVVFRNYVPVWHTQAWWIGHHSNFIFVFGSPYYWDAGYWYPAWGYYPGSFYYYEGPIYSGSASVSPVDMVMRVQSALKVQGYYAGAIDGVAGEETQSALADYQADHGLYETSAIDEPTLESLGLS